MHRINLNIDNNHKLGYSKLKLFLFVHPLTNMSPLPTGTVTFLFSDIEGSTQLWEQHPQAMKSALAKHDVILRRAVEAHDGQIVKTTGDGIHAVFDTAFNGLAAALAAQRGLNAEAWEEIKPHTVRVRMALHTGVAELRAGDYYGSAVNRAARLMSIGHGGQVLISNITAALVHEGLPTNVTLRDLGEHQLKDLVKSEHIYQMVDPSLPSEFPPLKTFDLLPNNLPIQLTSFIGRTKEIADIKVLLGKGRLITLTGSGGAGKTRLALEVGNLELAKYPQGVWLIELAPLTDPNQIIPSIAQLFGLQEVPFNPLPSLVVDYLRAKQALLILDNCEHLVEACARLTDDLLHQCPQLKIIACSRETLCIAGEIAYRVPSLISAESVQLFVERARAANQDFDWTEKNASSIAEICSRLDGIPLAIELAAARVRLLSPEQIAARLTDRFRLLIGGSRTSLPRQQTLRALIDWSYDLLSDSEKRLLQISSVFAGGWTLEALDAVAEDPDTMAYLEQLINKSLVVAGERENEMRYSLPETIRQYSHEKLIASGLLTQANKRHFAYFDDLSETAWNNLHKFEIIVSQTNLDDEIENFRAALAWGLEHHPEKTLHLATNTCMIMGWTGNLTEAHRWLRSALEAFDKLPPVTGESLLSRQRLRAKAFWVSAITESALGDNNSALQDAKEAIACARQIDDRSMLGYCLEMYSSAAHFVGASDGAAAAEEGLVVLRETGDQWGLAQAYINMALYALVSGNTAAQEAYTQNGLAALQAANTPYLSALCLFSLGMADRFRGNLDPAQRYFEEGLVLFRQLKNRHFENVMHSELGHISRQKGDFTKAHEIYRTTILRWQELGSRAAIANQLECFAFVSLAQNQPRRAATLLGAAEALRERISTAMTNWEHIEYDQAATQLHFSLNEAEWNAHWSAGRAMPMEQAIQFALED